MLLYDILQCARICANPPIADDSCAIRWSYSALESLNVTGKGGESCTIIGHTCNMWAGVEKTNTEAVRALRASESLDMYMHPKYDAVHVLYKFRIFIGTFN